MLDFCGADCQILETLSVQAAGVLASVRLVQKEQERRAMEHELDVAHRIQQALRPRGTGVCPHVQLAGISRPCTAVGGDFYDFMTLGCARTAFVIADVSGHGLGAALLATMLQGNFSAMALGPEPSSVFRNTNRFICEHTDLGRHATLFFGILDQDGALQYINAGHWPPLLIRSAGVEPVCAAGSIPLGLFPDSDFSAHRFSLQPADTLVLFTDGIVEARDAHENEYGIARLQEVAALHHQAAPQALADAIIESLERFTGRANHEDDITLLITRYMGAS
jgi:sigma-B regulation protein RsbU (phosphoserine phosphatase)